MDPDNQWTHGTIPNFSYLNADSEAKCDSLQH